MKSRVYRADASAERWFEEGCYILERLNDPRDPDLSVARARVPQGGATRWHRLIDTSERYLVLEGTGEAEVGDDGPVRLSTGDVLLIPPGERQRIRNTGESDLVFLAICTPRFQLENYREAS